MKTAFFAVCLFALAITALTQSLPPINPPLEEAQDLNASTDPNQPIAKPTLTPLPASNIPANHAGHQAVDPTATTAHAHPMDTTTKSAASDSTTPTPAPTTMHPDHHNHTETPNPGSGAVRYEHPFIIVAFIVALSLVNL